jgi:hypothetical protein
MNLQQRWDRPDPRAELRRTQVCVNPTHVCVNPTHACVNSTHVCVNSTQARRSRAEAERLSAQADALQAKGERMQRAVSHEMVSAPRSPPGRIWEADVLPALTGTALEQYQKIRRFRPYPKPALARAQAGITKSFAAALVSSQSAGAVAVSSLPHGAALPPAGGVPCGARHRVEHRARRLPRDAVRAAGVAAAGQPAAGVRRVAQRARRDGASAVAALRLPRYTHPTSAAPQ